MRRVTTNWGCLQAPCSADCRWKGLRWRKQPAGTDRISLVTTTAGSPVVQQQTRRYQALGTPSSGKCRLYSMVLTNEKMEISGQRKRTPVHCLECARGNRGLAPYHVALTGTTGASNPISIHARVSIYAEMRLLLTGYYSSCI